MGSENILQSDLPSSNFYGRLVYKFSYLKSFSDWHASWINELDVVFFPHCPLNPEQDRERQQAEVAQARPISTARSMPAVWIPPGRSWTCCGGELKEVA